MQVNVTAQQDSQLQSPTGPEIRENRAHRRLQEVTQGCRWDDGTEG